MNFETKAVRITGESLSEKYTLPIIVRLITSEGLAHFVVIHKAYKNHFLIADPAKGLRKIEKSEILNDFDGFAIFCVPTDKFLAEKMESKSVFSRFVKLLLKQKKLFIIAIISSIILTLLGIASSFFNKILMDEILPLMKLRGIIINLRFLSVTISFLHQLVFLNILNMVMYIV